MDLEEERGIVKDEFEAKRSEILAALPETYKSLWGRVGMAKTNWGNEWLPCLFLGPYDIGPTHPMRQLWMGMFVRQMNNECDERAPFGIDADTSTSSFTLRHHVEQA